MSRDYLRKTETVDDYTQQDFPYKGLSLDERFVTQPFPYQEATIEWMVAREKAPPVDGISGGFVFHEMGLGKTFCALSCSVLAGGRTLVVCPAILTSVWVSEIARHFAGVSCYLYYGAQRKAAYLERCGPGGAGLPQIVVTAYTTVNSDIEDLNGLFNKETFHRLILDESHFIRNAKTIAFRAIDRVPAEIKWLLSGTPLPNCVSEMYPYLKLLGYRYVRNVDQLSKKAFTKRFLTRTGYLNMQTLLKRVAIRRTKEILDLPERKLHNVAVEMIPEERAFYLALKSYSKERLKKLLKNLRRVSYSGLGRQLQARLRMINLQSVLSLIFHLRLACCDPGLVIDKIPRLAGVQGLDDAAIWLADASAATDDCPVCHNDKATVVNTSCNHFACRSCWDKLEKMEPVAVCFECMSPMSSKHLQEMRASPASLARQARQAGQDDGHDGHDGLDEQVVARFRSSKTRAILKRIAHELHRGEKIIIVSQWVRYLQVIIDEFTRKHRDVSYVVLTGAVVPTKRQKIISQFQLEPEPRVMFASLGSSAEGITLTAACRMIIAEPYWNQAKTLQVSDRIHRIGQTQAVKIYCMFAEQSIEVKILELIEKKAECVSVILDCKKITGSAENWLNRVVKLLED